MSMKFRDELARMCIDGMCTSTLGKSLRSRPSILDDVESSPSCSRLFAAKEGYVRCVLRASRPDRERVEQGSETLYTLSLRIFWPMKKKRKKADYIYTYTLKFHITPISLKILNIFE